MTANARFAPHKLAAQFVSPQGPPEAHPDRVVYGLMQPILGARMLARDGELLRAALVPAGLLAVFSLLVGIVEADGWGLREIARDSYHLLVLLAPVPSVLLARHYARLAVLARHKLGFAPSQPCIEPLWYALKRMVKQTIIVAIGLIPLTVVLHFVPVAGPLVARAVAAVWALHWVVVDAFDSARTLRPGQTLTELDAEALTARRPWFVRLLERAGERTPVVGGLLLRFARRCDGMATPWREEMAMIEDHPSLMVGFALATAALVATPVLNLLFRPIVLIGAAHVMGQLAEAHAAALAAAAATAAPAPAAERVSPASASPASAFTAPASASPATASTAPASASPATASTAPASALPATDSGSPVSASAATDPRSLATASAATDSPSPASASPPSSATAVRLPTAPDSPATSSSSPSTPSAAAPSGTRAKR